MNLRQINTKTISGPFYTYRRIHSPAKMHRDFQLHDRTPVLRDKNIIMRMMCSD